MPIQTRVVVIKQFPNYHYKLGKQKKEESFGWHTSFVGSFLGSIHFISDIKHGLGIVGYIGK